jgi:hypothetical protein
MFNKHTLIRWCVSYTLYARGPHPQSHFEEMATKSKWDTRSLLAVARRLGVEAYEQDGVTWWRLPEVVVPFMPREAFRNWKPSRVSGEAA